MTALLPVSSRALRLCLYGCLVTCIVCECLSLADDILDPMLWPDGAEYGAILLVLAGVYYQHIPDRERIERWRARAVACLVLGLVSLLSIAYTNPESPLTAVPFAVLIVGAIVAYRGLYDECTRPRP
ncbi:hypothetical protein [Salinigranum salinum]|uniref:hypothetical protein n=1 Tax=Salinigranum salinum TaxID=1364937 RepID=UPI001260EF0E|nr:hypothetical protein [Salinigranum salinum]